LQRIEPNIYKSGDKYFVGIIRKGCDFSIYFNCLDEAREYLKEVKCIEHGSRIWQQDSVIYKGQGFIILRKENQVHAILVDKDMIEDLMKVSWCINKSGYAYGFVRGEKMFMHQYIMANKKQHGFVINHINHNKLDNRRNNLEFITQSDNIKKGYENKKKGLEGVGV